MLAQPRRPRNNRSSDDDDDDDNARVGPSDARESSTSAPREFVAQLALASKLAAGRRRAAVFCGGARARAHALPRGEMRARTTLAADTTCARAAFAAAAAAAIGARARARACAGVARGTRKLKVNLEYDLRRV